MAFAIATATACMVNCYKLNYLLTHLLYKLFIFYPTTTARVPGGMVQYCAGFPANLTAA